MIKKIFWTILLLITLYILSIFKAPSIAQNIEDFLGIKWFNEFIINFKKTLDGSATDIPSKDEFLSWATDIKDKLINWIGTTKEKIDSVRYSLWEIEDTAEEIKNTYDEAKKFVQETEEKIEEVKNKASKVSDNIENIANSWTKN